MQYNKNWFPELKGYTSPSNRRHIHHPKTIIGADTWIGNGAKIISGITIGHGSIVGAGAVVTKDIKPYSIVGGIPAKKIKNRFSDEIINSLLETKWWTLPHSTIKELPFDNIDEVINILNKKNALQK
jgi:NDP-sugar pyrophosphorylase family protein